MSLQAETTAVLQRYGTGKLKTTGSNPSNTNRRTQEEGDRPRKRRPRVKRRKRVKLGVKAGDKAVKTLKNATLTEPYAQESSPAAETRKAWAPLNTRETVEVLDPAVTFGAVEDGYDTDDSDQGGDLEIHKVMERVEGEKEAERSRRDLEFNSEEDRVRDSTDAFIAGPSVTMEGLAMERERLDRIAAAGQRNLVRLEEEQLERESRVNWLMEDISANEIQRAYRGRIGRRRSELVRKLKGYDSAVTSGWIEVRDQERGEVWYYNQISGESSWERPAEMRTIPEPEKVKTLPPVSPIVKVDPASVVKNLASSPDGEEKKDSEPLPSISNATSFVDSTTKQSSLGVSFAADTAASLPPIVNQADSEDADENDDDFEDIDSEEDEFEFSDMDDEKDRLFLADGSVNLRLRDTIEQSLRVSRFDSVSTLLASGGKELSLNEAKRKRAQKKKKKRRGDKGKRERPIFLQDDSNKKMVSVMRIKGLQDDSEEEQEERRSPTKKKAVSPDTKDPKTLAIHDIPHTGFDLNKDDELHPDNQLDDDMDPDYHMYNAPKQNPDGTNDTTQSQVDQWKSTGKTKGVCFNCWSAGKGKKCMLHKEEAASNGQVQKKTESALMCKNWDLGVLRRRYRAEEIQEVFMRSASSLRYDKDRKQFCTVVEQKHPIYRLTSHRLAKYNFTSRRKQHVRSWLHSFIELLRTGKIPGEKVGKSAKMLRLRNSLVNLRVVRKYGNKSYTRHPKAPITGTTLAELRGQLKLIQERELEFDRPEGKKETKVFRYIVVDGVPVPVALYLPRVYELFAPKSIPMPEPSYKEEPEVATPNLYISEDEPTAWLERLVSRVSRDMTTQAKLMVQTMSPIPGIDKLKRTKYPPPLTIKFATFARKPTRNNMAMGGLSAELTVYELVTTYVPPQYGHFTVMDRASLAPDISEEITAKFLSALVDPFPQTYVERMLQHPLNSRRPPTVTLSTAMDPSNKHYFGENRPSQTGEEAHHGFRTAVWCMAPLFDPTTDSSTFLPSHDVATLNLPAANRTVTTHADRNYPFCEPTNRDNTTLDFYHLLLLGVCSPSKSQVFTNLGVQEPGDFMRGCDPAKPLGHCVAVIYRSWAFLQKAPIEEFLTDDGVPYWYDRRTGETFWERPLHKEEKVPVKQGGSVLGGGGEMPSIGQGASQGYEPRYDQRDMRKAMIRKHESEEMTIERRKAAAQSAVWAKEQGILPELPKIDIQDEKEADDGSLVSDNSGKINAAFKRSISGNKAPHDTVPTEVATPGSPPRLGSPSRGRRNSNLGSPTSLKGSPGRRRSVSNVSEQSMGFTQPTASVQVDAQTAGIVQSITTGLAASLQGVSNPEDILKLGMGLGMTLGAQGLIPQQPTSPGKESESGQKDQEQERPQTGNSGWDVKVREPVNGHPIGMASPNKVAGSMESLDHTSEEQQKARLLSDTAEIKTSDTFKGLVVVEPTAAPDEIVGRSGNVLMDSEDMMKLTVPVVAYPDRVGPLEQEFETHPAAGVGTSFVRQGEGESQKLVQGEGGVVVRRSSEPIPEGFLNAISATHVGQQNVDYLPNVPNLPQCKPVGRVKPRSAAEDWLAIGFDPWSAGKEPLSTEFITSLTTAAASVKDDSILDNKEAEGAFINLMDKKGMEAMQEIAAQENKMAQDFEELCSFVRHGKYREVEEKMNEPDWTLPIDYPDAVGNTLLMVACQNGNKRIAKLCLRRGAELNKQNINGQSCLHYAYGYGFEELGEYLIEKGADDSLKNADQLTCYEGLNLNDVQGI